ncbi:Cytidine deaminase [Eumeta japonica]|uniref:Cytidine deaminase n=1 Tax=Eumeta variegata TaxID=151549 RepID=A0A4C1UUJ4_EUMVA|nr:Cytidine deaminase [Eumeta japonica]
MENFKILNFNLLNPIVQNLIKEAAEVRKKAYCTYSHFAVGAAILAEGGDKVYTGCNIENVAYSPTICAERSAVPKAVEDGHLKFEMVAVVANSDGSYTAPCGVCRQTLAEFRGSNGDIDIYLSKPEMDQVLVTKLSQLLPLSFVSFNKDVDF